LVTVLKKVLPHTYDASGFCLVCIDSLNILYNLICCFGPGNYYLDQDCCGLRQFSKASVRLVDPP